MTKSSISPDVQERVDKMLREKMAEYQRDHTAKVETKYGNTYISYGVYDYLISQYLQELIKLFELMRIEYATCIPIGWEETCFISIKGEDADRASFIQKFIDNGYKLSWK